MWKYSRELKAEGECKAPLKSLGERQFSCCVTAFYSKGPVREDTKLELPDFFVEMITAPDALRVPWSTLPVALPLEA